MVTWKGSQFSGCPALGNLSRDATDKWPHLQNWALKHSTTFEHQLLGKILTRVSFHEMQLRGRNNYIRSWSSRQSLKLPQCHKTAIPLVAGLTGPLWSVLMVVDNHSFNYSNVSKATEDILNVPNVTDPICLQLCLHVSVIGTEIWNHGNLINVNQDMSQLLDSFNWTVHLYPHLPRFWASICVQGLF